MVRSSSTYSTSTHSSVSVPKNVEAVVFGAPTSNPARSPGVNRTPDASTSSASV